MGLSRNGQRGRVLRVFPRKTFGEFSPLFFQSKLPPHTPTECAPSFNEEVRLDCKRPQTFSVSRLLSFTRKWGGGQLTSLKFGAPRAASNVVPFSFDFSRDRSGVDMDRVLLEPILAEGRSDDGLPRCEGAGMALGHLIRQVRNGRLAPNELWQASCDWNAAINVPNWPEEKLRVNLDRLVRRDVEKNGPLVPPAPVVSTAPSHSKLADWNIKRFQSKAPERHWLVEGLIPAGTAGVFAAVGDAGKSMMALRLAYVVGCYPDLGAFNPAIQDAPAPKFFGRPIIGRGTSIVLTAEDDVAEVWRRIEALDPSNLRAGQPRMIVRPMISDGGPRAIIEDGPAGPQPTEFWRELRAELTAIPDLKLLVLDPLSHFAAAKLDFDNQAGAALMAMLDAFAAETAAAVILVHHMSKSTVPTNLTDARTAIRGAGSLVDNGRLCPGDVGSRRGCGL
jgi:AAA domain